MKKFLVKILLYILIVAGITFAVNKIYVEKMFYDSSEVSKFHEVPENIEICNFGSSHGVHSYYYDDLNAEYTCFNFALDSQFLSYDERILEAYKGNLTPNGVAIIDISFFTCWGYPETESDSFESKNKRYYRFLPKPLIKNYDLYTDIIVSKLPSLDVGLSAVASTILKPKNEITEIKSYPDVEAVVDISKLQEDTSLSCQRHIFENKRDVNGELFYNDEEIQALYDIVEICRDINVTPIFVTVPYLREYTETIEREDGDFYDQFYEWIYSTAEDLDVEYYDYSLDERFINDYSLFYNGDHMNSDGARKFTNILYDEVIKDVIKNSDL